MTTGIKWNKGVPPNEEREFLFSFGTDKVYVLKWAKRFGAWCPHDGSHSYVNPSYWADINYPNSEEPK